MDGITRKCTKMRLPYRWARYFGYKKGWRGIGIVKRSMCKYPNAQFTSTGNGPPISSTGTITGSEQSHFQYCVYRSFFLFSGSGAYSKSLGKRIGLHPPSPHPVTRSI